jgi:hypothetical protein
MTLEHPDYPPRRRRVRGAGPARQLSGTCPGERATTLYLLPGLPRGLTLTERAKQELLATPEPVVLDMPVAGWIGIMVRHVDALAEMLDSARTQASRDYDAQKAALLTGRLRRAMGLGSISDATTGNTAQISGKEVTDLIATARSESEADHDLLRGLLRRAANHHLATYSLIARELAALVDELDELAAHGLGCDRREPGPCPSDDPSPGGQAS